MSSYGKFECLPGFVASTAISQYYIVRLATTAGQVALAATPASDDVIGVIQNDPSTGEAAEVAFQGICKVLSEDSVGIGDYVTCSSTSRAKSTTTDGDHTIGIALDAGSAGSLIRVAIVLGTHEAA